MPRTAPKLPKKGTTETAVVEQGTSTGGFNPNAAAVSYITSSIPTASNPNNLEKATEAQLNKELIDMTPAERIAYANRLRDAGYRVGNINGQVTKALRRAWLDAHSDLTTEITDAGQQLDLPTFLEINKGGGGDGSGVNVQTSQINDTAAASIINQVYRSLVGQEATPDEIARLTKEVRQAQADNPTRTAYSSSSSSTTGGLDVQQFLTQQIQDTQPAIENRATDAYQIMFEELGGLR